MAGPHIYLVNVLFNKVGNKQMPNNELKFTARMKVAFIFLHLLGKCIIYWKIPRNAIDSYGCTGKNFLLNITKCCKKYY